MDTSHFLRIHNQQKVSLIMWGHLEPLGGCQPNKKTERHNLFREANSVGTDDLTGYLGTHPQAVYVQWYLNNFARVIMKHALPLPYWSLVMFFLFI